MFNFPIKVWQKNFESDMKVSKGPNDHKKKENSYEVN